MRSERGSAPIEPQGAERRGGADETVAFQRFVSCARLAAIHLGLGRWRQRVDDLATAAVSILGLWIAQRRAPHRTRPWLRRVVKHLAARDARRRHGLEHVDLASCAAPDPVDADPGALRAAFERLLVVMRLTPRQGRLVDACRAGARTNDELARACGMAERDVRRCLQAIVKKARKALQKPAPP